MKDGRIRTRSRRVWTDWVSVIKPRILLSNLLCAAAGYGLASGWENPQKLAVMLAGTGLAMAAASMLNNYIDRNRDKRMARTRNRPLPDGRLQPMAVLAAGIIAGLAGLYLLYVLVNPLSMILGLTGLVVYAGVYSVWLKPRSTWSTSVGGISGAMPPVIGYCSWTGGLDPGAWLLFLLLFLWQPPHFWALAILKKEEYREAGFPLLPVVKGTRRTRIQMVPYLAGLYTVNALFYYYGILGLGYQIVTSVLLVLWTAVYASGFVRMDERAWARSHFRWSLIVLTGAVLAMMAESADIL